MRKFTLSPACSFVVLGVRPASCCRWRQRPVLLVIRPISLHCGMDTRPVVIRVWHAVLAPPYVVSAQAEA